MPRESPIPPASELELPALGPIARLLAESFDLLAARLPDAHARMLAPLRGLELELILDAEALHLRFEHGVELTAGGGELVPGCPRIECRLPTILAVLDAKLSLVEAVESDALQVRADLDRLVLLHEGLLAYVHGAVRCPGFPELLTRLRALAQSPP